MSVAAMAWALTEAPAETAQERLILVALADRAHTDGTGAFPGQEELAERGLCSTRTVARVLTALEDRGLIYRGDQELVAHYRYRPVVWDLNMLLRQAGQSVTPEVGQSVTPQNRPTTAPRGMTNPPSRYDKSGHQGMTLVADKPRTKPREKPKEGRASFAPPSPPAGDPSTALPRCSSHSGMLSPPPCRACGQARIAAQDAAAAARAQTAARARAVREEVNQAAARAISACSLCDSDGYRGTTVCDHVDRTGTARRGRALVQAALDGARSESLSP